MSRENVEVVRRAYEAAGAMPAPDVQTMLQLYARDHLFTTDWGTGDGRTYRGLDGYRDAMRTVAELWDDFRNDIEEIIDAGEDVVVALIRATGRGKTSGAPVEMRTGAVIRLRGGVIVSTTYYARAEDALEAAGLGE